MKRSQATIFTGLNNEESKESKTIVSEMLEKHWRAKQANEREDKLLRHRIDTIEKQKRAALMGIKKEKQSLQILLRKNIQRCRGSRKLAASQSQMSVSLPDIRSPKQQNVLGMTRRKSSDVHVGGLPRMHQTSNLRLTKSSSHMPDVLAISTPSLIDNKDDDEDIELIDLSKPTFRHQSASPPPRCRKYMLPALGVSSHTATLSPLAIRHAFVSPEKKKPPRDSFET